MVDILIKRYLWLIDYLRVHGSSTYEQIASAWERSSQNDNGSQLTRRTLYNHIQSVSKLFGIEITCRRGRGLNVYGIANPEAIKEKTLNNWVLESFALGSLFLDKFDLADKISVGEIPSSQDYLESILKSLRQNVCLNVDYCNFVGKGFCKMKVQPLCLKLFKRRWYLLCDVPVLGQKRILSLDRISSLELTGEQFDYPTDFSADSFFSPYFGIIAIMNGVQEKITLRAYDELPAYLRSLPIHHSQQEADSGEGYTDFEVNLVPTFDFIQEILSHREQLEVVSPEWLRKDVANLIGRMTRLYNSRNGNQAGEEGACSE